MEVPEQVSLLESTALQPLKDVPVALREVMLLPGANRSMSWFELVNPETASALVVEPMAVAFLMHAGAEMPLVSPSFPVAETTVMFLPTAVLMAAAVSGSSASQ